MTKQHDTGRHAIIAGGGIGGLAAAIGLRRVGWSVTVLERAGESREVGAGWSFAPNAVQAIDALGVGAEFRAISQPSEASDRRRPDRRGRNSQCVADFRLAPHADPVFQRILVWRGVTAPGSVWPVDGFQTWGRGVRFAANPISQERVFWFVAIRRLEPHVHVELDPAEPLRTHRDDHSGAIAGWFPNIRPYPAQEIALLQARRDPASKTPGPNLIR
ncbi:FAD-dependent monooxygenase [Nocardia sp. NPDC088792]|uniref:FAD-dependent monooxygenase n=1 Tax=Nocardia sp. NPDC088792 TaxID=3364332 RepID=UPI0037FD2DFB